MRLSFGGTTISLRQTLEEILDLQVQWTAADSPAMRQRGKLIRDALPAEMMRWRPEIAHALGRYGADLAANGRDATGLKSRVPWARYFSARMSAKATIGWYVVYLVHPDAAGVSLCLSHGSTIFNAGSYQRRGTEEVRELMAWARSIAGDAFGADDAVSAGLNLGHGGLARDYERTTLFSKFYRKGFLPTDEELGADLVAFGAVLADLYTAADEGRSPGSSGRDVLDALDLVDEIASPLRGGGRGQGRGLNAERRRAVELRAMEVAKVWLKQEGFKSVKDVSRTQSCDFSARRDGKTWVVEVKGTTGGPGSILLTRNEVALHRTKYPRNVLLVVHGIKLSTDGLEATLGTLLPLSPWELHNDRLSPTCYEYRLG